MTVVVRIVEVTWPACVDAARFHAPADADLMVLHIPGHEAPGVAQAPIPDCWVAPLPTASPARRWNTSPPRPASICRPPEPTGRGTRAAAPGARCGRGDGTSWRPPKVPSCSS
ncbi:hypothetical protein [Streptomyces sp. NPDC086989]|uniref:hypothetical protein n=1 Tax=Streptomyces sp. NPDC086989 TaxID=3365764 RepID=UPI00381A5F9F